MEPLETTSRTSLIRRFLAIPYRMKTTTRYMMFLFMRHRWRSMLVSAYVPLPL
jgi:hypothetical protein